MSNDYYNDDGSPASLTRGSSSVIRTALAQIRAGFDKLPSLARLWGGNASYAVATGSANAWDVSVASTYLTSFVDGMTVRVKFPDLNTSTTPTLNLNGLGARTICRDSGVALAVSDITPNMVATLTYNSSFDKWQLLQSLSGTASDINAANLAAATGASLIGFARSGGNGLQRTLLDKSRDVVSIKDTIGVTGNAGEQQGTGLNNAIAAAAARGYCDIFVPDGYYDTNTPIVLLPGVTLRMSKNAIFRATQAMSALIQSPADQPMFDVGIYGGRLHCEDLADVGLDVQWFQHYKLQDTYIERFNAIGARFGVAGTAYSSFEAMIRGLKTFRNTGAIAAGSVALHLRTATDCKVAQSVLVGAETGVLANSGGHWLEQVHCWPGQTGTMKYGFDDQAGTNTYVGCFADTPGIAGYRVAFGNIALIGCRTFMNTLGGSDNVADGVLITSAAPNCTIIGLVAIGANSSFRLKTDINYAAVTDPYSTTHIVGTVSNNVVTKAPSFVRNTELLGLWANGARRMDMSLDGSANLNLKRRDSSGTLLGTPIAISNSTGQVSFQDGGIDTKGTFSSPTTIGGLRVWTNPSTNLLMGKSTNPAGASDGSPVLLKKLTGTTSGSIGTSVNVAHGLGYNPTYIIVSSRGAGAVYQSGASDATNIPIAGTAASLNFDVYVG